MFLNRFETAYSHISVLTLKNLSQYSCPGFALPHDLDFGGPDKKVQKAFGDSRASFFLLTDAAKQHIGCELKL